jgi:hypothetical protein
MQNLAVMAINDENQKEMIKYASAETSNLINYIDQVEVLLKQYNQYIINNQTKSLPIISVVAYEASATPTKSNVKVRLLNTDNDVLNDVNCSIQAVGNKDISIVGGPTINYAKILSDEIVDGNRVLINSSSKRSNILGVTANEKKDGSYFGDDFFVMQYFDTSPNTQNSSSEIDSYVYPNPFSSLKQEALIRFRISHSSEVTIKIYDPSNALVITLCAGLPIPENSERVIAWRGDNEIGEMVSNGTYYYLITTASGAKYVGKVSVVK